MFPEMLRRQLGQNQYKLYDNNVSLVTESTSVSLSSGTPVEETMELLSWSGKGSIQYVRPRIQKSIADENAGIMEDAVSLVCYVPFEAAPDESMLVVDVDGVIGTPGQRYPQSRKPANVGGANIYWELYLGLAVND